MSEDITARTPSANGRFLKYNATGRSKGELIARINKVLKPEAPFIALPVRLVQSPAWRAMSLNARRFVDFLIVENERHRKTENGNLLATYDQLEAWGLHREAIRPAIDEAIRLGLVRQVGERHLRVPNRFELTFFGAVRGYTPSPPTHDWERHKADPKQLAKQQKKERNKQKSGPKNRTSLVRKSEPEMRRDGAELEPNPLESNHSSTPSQADSGPDFLTPYIVWEGSAGEAADVKAESFQEADDVSSEVRIPEPFLNPDETEQERSVGPTDLEPSMLRGRRGAKVSSSNQFELFPKPDP